MDKPNGLSGGVRRGRAEPQDVREIFTNVLKKQLKIRIFRHMIILMKNFHLIKNFFSNFALKFGQKFRSRHLWEMRGGVGEHPEASELIKEIV